MSKKEIIIPKGYHERESKMDKGSDVLQTKKYSEVWEIFRKQILWEYRCEIVPLERANHRWLEEDLYAKHASPFDDVTLHDGISFDYDKVFKECNGNFTDHITKNYRKVPMGTKMADSHDTFIKDEQCEFLEDGRVKFLRTPRKNQGVLWKNRSLEPGEPIIQSGKQLRPDQLSMIAMGGYSKIKVRKKIRVAILPTGKEMIQPGERLSSGKRVESNGIYLKTLYEDMGAESVLLDIIRDERELKDRILSIHEDYDVIVTIGGVGKGRLKNEDYTAKVIEELGKIINHGVMISPGGGPSLYGMIEGTPVVGLPGPPHACLVLGEYMMLPLIEDYYGAPLKGYEFVEAELKKDFYARGNTYWFVHVNVSAENGKYIIRPIDDIGDSVDNFVRANAQMLVLPNEHYQAGEKKIVRLLESILTIHPNHRWRQYMNDSFMK